MHVSLWLSQKSQRWEKKATVMAFTKFCHTICATSIADMHRFHLHLQKDRLLNADNPFSMDFLVPRLRPNTEYNIICVTDAFSLFASFEMCPRNVCVYGIRFHPETLMHNHHRKFMWMKSTSCHCHWQQKFGSNTHRILKFSVGFFTSTKTKNRKEKNKIGHKSPFTYGLWHNVIHTSMRSIVIIFTCGCVHCSTAQSAYTSSINRKY